MITEKEKIWLHTISETPTEELIKQRVIFHDNAFKEELQAFVNFLVLELRRKDDLLKKIKQEVLKLQMEQSMDFHKIDLSIFDLKD